MVQGRFLQRFIENLLLGLDSIDASSTIYYNKRSGGVPMKKIICYKRLWLLLFAPAAFLLSYIASRTPAFAEWYAVTIYPALSKSGNLVTSFVPFSIAELLIMLFIIGTAVYLIVCVIKIRKGRGSRGKYLFLSLITPVCLASVLYFVFMLDCGINYSRYTFAQTSGLEVRPSSKTELTALCNALGDKVNALRKEVKVNEKSVMKLKSENIYETAKEAQAAFNKVHQQYPLLLAGYGQPKPVIGSRLMSWCNITGVFFPFTFEANVNVDVPQYSIPATMCHELSHLRGYMREDEANFIGYLACENSDTPDFQYSGNMLAFIYTYNALSDADSGAAGKVYAKLSDGVKRELADDYAYWEQFKGPVAVAASAVNDSYLKANKQEDGVKSYGRMVDLLLAEYRANQKAR